MRRLSDLIAAAINLAFLQSILPMNPDNFVEFVAGITPDELASALETYGANHFFVFSLAIIYILTGTQLAFPENLIVLCIKYVFRQEEGTIEFLKVLSRYHCKCVQFINGFKPNELADALQTHGQNTNFVFSLAIIYIRAGATKAFPQKLAELVYDAVFRQVDGTQEFLAALNGAFLVDKTKVSRSLWGLCESATSEDLNSFLNARNSSPLILFYWLHLAVGGEKQIVKELFQILARIARQNIKPNPKVSYADVIRAILDNQSYFLFHETNGVFAVILDKGFVGNILNLFEVPWNFTFAELLLVQQFLQKRPIDASWLLRPDYMSVQCSRFLIKTVMNLADDLLDSSGRLTEASLLLPANFARIGRFVYLSDHHHLEQIFRSNQFIFDTHVIPGKYAISFVLHFFMNLHFRRNPELFSRMLVSLKTYGDQLLKADLTAMKTALTHFHEDRKAEAAIFAAFMCIDRSEQIPCLKNHISVLKTIFMVIGNPIHTLCVRDCDPTKLQEIVCSLRKILPDFILNARMVFVNGISFLPVVNLHATSQPVIAFLQAHALAGSFPCMLQLLMTSDHLDLFKVHMIAVMSFIGAQVDRVGQDDGQYQLNLAEMLNILHACFTKLDIKMLDFNNHICALFTNPIVLNAFVADPRFAEQTRGLRNDRKIARMRQECQAHCAQHGTTMPEAQRALGLVVFGGCPICTELSTPEFTTVFQCGHCFCTGCAEQIKNCPNCRAKIIHRTQPDSLGIRFRPDPAPQASGQPAQKKQRQEE
jgi:hypothetical protein